jgi:hypothetical protein
LLVAVATPGRFLSAFATDPGSGIGGRPPRRLSSAESGGAPPMSEGIGSDTRACVGVPAIP